MFITALTNFIEKIIHSYYFTGLDDRKHKLYFDFTISTLQLIIQFGRSCILVLSGNFNNVSNNIVCEM